MSIKTKVEKEGKATDYTKIEKEIDAQAEVIWDLASHI